MNISGLDYFRQRDRARSVEEEYPRIKFFYPPILKFDAGSNVTVELDCEYRYAIEIERHYKRKNHKGEESIHRVTLDPPFIFMLRDFLNKQFPPKDDAEIQALHDAYIKELVDNP